MKSRMSSFNSKTIVWKSLDLVQGREWLELDKNLAQSEIQRIDEVGKDFTLIYKLEWSDDFIWKSLDLAVRRGSETKKLKLKNDGSSFDIDIWPTPFTNSLSLKRLNLKIGESKAICPQWVDGPSLKVMTRKQRYTRKSEDNFLFESLDDDFKAEIEVDEDQLVMNYPGLFERME